MPFLRLLACLLLLASCQPFSNRVDSLEIQCGPSDTQGLVKILAADGRELEAQDLAIYRREGEAFSRVEPTRKGCFAHDPAHDYVIHAGNNQGLVVPRAEAPRIVTLRDVQTSELSFNCPTQAVPNDFDFGTVFGNTGELDGFALDLRVSGLETSFATQKAALVSRRDYSLKPFTNAPDGRYTLEVKAQNLLKNLPARPLRCDIRIDSTAPRVSLEPGSFLPLVSQGFTLIEPTAKIRFNTDDSSRTEILSCWTSQKEALLEPERKADCTLQAVGSEISPPSEGYWTLSYQSVDEAGQRSPRMQQAFLVYQGGTLRELSLDMELAGFLFENNQNLRAVVKTLSAESRRRQLPTAYEREEAAPAVAANLYQMGPRKIPYFEKKMASLRFVSITPDGARTLVNQLEPDNALIGLDSRTGKELWRNVHQNGRMYRNVFTADSRLMISSGALSGELLIWSTETGELLKRIPRPPREGYESRVFDMFLTGNDRYLGAAGFDDTVYIYDLAADEPTLVSSVSYDKFLLSFAFSPSGDRFVTSVGQSALVYSRDGTLLETVTRTDGNYVSAAAFLSEDEIVLSSVEKTDRENRRKFKCGFFYARLGEAPLRMATIAGNIDKILPSPDRQHFVAIGIGSNGAPFFPNWRQWLKDPVPAPFEETAYARLNGLESTDGTYWTRDSLRVITTSGEDGADGFIRAFNIEGGLELEIGPGSRNAFVADASSRLVRYTVDGLLEFWDFLKAPIDRFVRPQRVQVAKYAADQSRFYTIEESGLENDVRKSLRVWDRKSLKELVRTETDAAYINTLMCSAFVTAEELIFPADQYRLERLDIRDGSRSVVVDRSDPAIQAERGAIISFAVSRDGARLALGYALGFVEIVEVATKKTLYLAQLHESSVYVQSGDIFAKAVASLSFRGASSDVLSAGQDGQIIALTAASDGTYTPEVIFRVPEVIYHIAVDDDYLVIAARLNTVFVYQFSRGVLTQLPLDTLLPVMVELNSRQNMVSVATTFGDLYSFNLAEGTVRQRTRLKRGVLEVRALSISADGADTLTAVQGDVLFLPNKAETLFDRYCQYLSAMQICPNSPQR